jgi:hypothetical protein
MSEWMQRIIESKRATRRELAALPYAEKMKVVQRLQEAAKLLKSMQLKKVTRS